MAKNSKKKAVLKKKKYFHKFEVYDFIEKIKLSEKRRPTYYKGKAKIPKKYQNDEYGYNKNGVLVKISTGDRVIKNAISVGTPNIKMITGQYFWMGANPHIRRKIKRDMSKFFYKYMKDIPKVEEHQYPIGVRIDLYDDENVGQDLDNFMPVYRKVIHDILTAKEMDHEAIIVDDDKKHIQDIPTKFYPIDDHKNRKLYIEIYSI